jgi:hypothetical protein
LDGFGFVDMKTIKNKEQPKKPSGRVGVFWIYQGTILAASFPLKDGEEYGDAINGGVDHVDFWPKLQAQHPELRGLEYEEVPRGRVVFMKQAKKYHVYRDKTLSGPVSKRAVIQEFALAGAKVLFRTDPHYTTDRQELARLFSRE